MALSPFTLHSSPLIIVAHRGASADAPENTLPAFQLAWQQGADAIEGDFHLTRDKQIVCIHNPTTAKYSRRSLTVRKSKLADLQALDVGSWKSPEFVGTKIPTLAQVLATIPPGKKLYIEIKSSPQIVRHLLKEIDASGIDLSQLVVIAFSGRVIKTIKAQRPTLKAIWLVTPRHRSKGAELTPNGGEILATLKRIKADGASSYAHPEIDANYFQPILAAGYELHTWTVDDPALARKWTELGALSLTTNEPASLRASLETSDP